MAEQDSYKAPPHAGHETRDIDVRLLGLAGLSLVVLLAGGLGLMAWFFGTFTAPPALKGASSAATRPRPPGPGLQTTPRREIQTMRQTEREVLQSYTWIDRAAGIARIPLQRAMELVVERGLPVWQDPSASPPAGGETSEKGR